MLDVDKLNSLVQEGEHVYSTRYQNEFTYYNFVDSEKFTKWQTKLITYFEQNLDKNNFALKKLKKEVISPDPEHVKIGIGILKSQIETLKNNSFQQDNVKAYGFQELDLLFDRFSIVVHQLKNRGHNRDALIIKDEYDVQYLLSSLLKLYFDDVRPEEWTPSYAGGSNRVDFLIKDIKTVIETKMTRPNLKDNKLGEELIIDIKKYAQHEDCETLYCFIYDPEGYINNPVGLKNDLERDKSINVKIIIVPHR